MKKVVSIALSIAITASSFVLPQTVANAAGDQTNVREITGRLQYFRYTDGQYLYFPAMQASGGEADGLYTYCMDQNLSCPGTGGQLYTEGGEIGDEAVRYILENGLISPGNHGNDGYATWDDNQDYYITQTALHVYHGTANFTYIASAPDDMLDAAQRLYIDATGNSIQVPVHPEELQEVCQNLNVDLSTLSQSEAETLATEQGIELKTIQPTKKSTNNESWISISPPEVNFTLNGDAFETDWFNVTHSDNCIDYNVSMSGAPAGTEVIGKDLSHFKFRIPVSAVTGNADITVNLSGLFEVGKSTSYLPPSSSFQPAAILKEQTTSAWSTNSAVAHLNALGRLWVQKVDSETGSTTPQGEGSFEGAQFAVYRMEASGETLVSIITTGADGRTAPTDWLLINHTYQIREIVAPPGYKISDPVDYYLTAESIQNIVTVNFPDNPIKGNVAITKHIDGTGIEKPEQGAEFQVYLKSAGSYDAAKDTEKDLITTDENGYAKTKDLPYGVYAVHQTKGQEGTLFADDFDVDVNEDGKTYYYIISDQLIEQYLKVVKQDAETGKTIALSGAGFKVKNMTTGEWVVQHITYPTPQDIDTFYTSQDGTLMLPQPLVYGSYELHEVQAPPGYLLNPSPIPFDVKSPQMQTIVLSMTDQVVKGRIQVTKAGESFSTVTTTKDPVYDNIYTPMYADKSQAGFVFKIYADEDIVTADGTIHAKKGDLVDTITTDQNGIATSKLLYLNGTSGKYKVVEDKAQPPFTINQKPVYVTLQYKDQHTPEVITYANVHNDRQKVNVTLMKEMETDKLFHIGNRDEYKNVRFGLFAAEKLIAGDETFVPQDGLIEVIGIEQLKQTYQGTFKADLPLGKYYVKEVATDEHYIINDTKYPFEFAYEGQTTQTVEVKINNSKPIENELIRSTVAIQKIDQDTGLPLADVGFKIYANNKTTVLKEGYTDQTGKLEFKDIPYGDYYYREFAVPKGYVLDDTLHPFEVKENHQTITLEAKNKEKAGSVTFNKPDSQSTDNLIQTSLPLTGDASKFVACVLMMAIGAGMGIMTMAQKKKNRK